MFSVVPFVCNGCKTGRYICFGCSSPIESENPDFLKTENSDQNPLTLTPLTLTPNPDQKGTKCSDPKCGRHFHLTCLKNYKNSIFNEKEKSWKCPHHICHSCATKVESNALKSNEFYQTKVKTIQGCPSKSTGRKNYRKL